MRKFDTKVQHLKYKVLREVARLAFEDLSLIHILLIRKYYPQALSCLAPVLSPMQAHCKSLRERHEGCAAVFIGPCISKKDEAAPVSYTHLDVYKRQGILVQNENMASSLALLCNHLSQRLTMQ